MHEFAHCLGLPVPTQPADAKAYDQHRQCNQDEPGRKPLVGGEEGYQALEVVDAIYRSCRTGEKVAFPAAAGE